MLSYRHGFHAGNHGDVLKHWVLVLCLEYLKQKDKPFFYIDTHAGSGQYSLKDPYARKTAEADAGIARLWEAADLPESLNLYLAQVRDQNKRGQNKGTLLQYPGSPALAAALLRPDDRMRLIELHGSDLVALVKLFARDPRVKVLDGDGFVAVKGLLPPESRRGLVLMDPSYEIKSDYNKVLTAMNECLKRFATGQYLVWYPLINSVSAQRFSEQLQKLPCSRWLDVKMAVSRPPQGHGMFGSGMFVINPPWTLREQLEQGLPALTQLLAQDDGAEWSIQEKSE
ncbi:MAG: 23S rRNA (adenine(2030)-N(6))-methyltransferase RlmJ [Pseudomonadota bacterium]|nr:23S rRNA (adenine(2030)-N(6))-methyltransferase RlmJ [Pseudomonadota bacterium]